MSRLASLIMAATFLLVPGDAAQSQDTTAIRASHPCTDCIRLTPVAVFGGDYTGDDLLSGSIALSRSSEGRTYISDFGSGRAEILVYDPDGEIKYTIRRRGQGPGEFLDPIQFLPLSDGRFFVFRDRATDPPESGRGIRVVSSLPREGVFRISGG